MRILGPCRSASTPTSRSSLAAAACASRARRRWSSGLPCERFRRTTATPSRRMLSSMPGASVAGPRVATILVRRVLFFIPPRYHKRSSWFRWNPLANGNAKSGRGVSEPGFFRCPLIALHRLANLLARGGGVAPAHDLHPLAGFEILVVLEEVRDAVAPVLRRVADVADVRVAPEHLVARHDHQLGIVTGLV